MLYITLGIWGKGQLVPIIMGVLILVLLDFSQGAYAIDHMVSDGSCVNDCDEITLGVNNEGRRLVENGITYNGNSIDVERYFTPFPLLIIHVGVPNKAVFKIYDSSGPDSIHHFELAFGLGKGQIIGTSNAIIEWNKSFDGTETVTLVDPHNALGNVRVTSAEGKCREDSTYNNCLILTIFHTFRESLDSNIVGTNVWDYHRNSLQNVYNHGIQIVGKSLNPPDEYVGIHAGNLIQIFETGKNTAVDEQDNTWIFDKTWKMDYLPKGKIIDKITARGIDRHHAWFNTYKQGQTLLAEFTMNKLCAQCNEMSFEEINNIKSYAFPIRTDKLLDPIIQHKMLDEAAKAQQKLDQMFERLYNHK